MISLLQVNSYYYNTINDNKLYNVAKKFYQHKDKIEQIEFSTDYHSDLSDRNKLFIQSCYYGDLSIVKYILSRYDIDTHAENDLAFTFACRQGHLDICKLLYMLDGVNVSTSYYEEEDETLDDDAPLILACKYGHFDVVNYLIQTNKVNVSEFAFKTACVNGYLDVAQLLYDHGKINIHADNDCIFYDCCEEGHLEIIKWLCSLDEFIVTTPITLAASNGHLNVIKYLCNQYPDYDIHENEDNVFRYCCFCGQLEIAQWTYSLDDTINISEYYHELFRQCCYRHNNLHIVKWVYDLDSRVNIYSVDEIKLLEYTGLTIEQLILKLTAS